MSEASKTETGIEGSESGVAVDRRKFMGGALTTAASVGAALTASAASAQQAPPPGGPGGPGGPGTLGSTIEKRYAPEPPTSRGPRLFRQEQDIRNCEVDGKLPADLSGAFFRTGPDAQFPLRQGNIPFDGEGHVSTFRFENGNVHFKSRYVRNERWLAQDKAGKILFPMYRNPYMD